MGSEVLLTVVCWLLLGHVRANNATSGTVDAKPKDSTASTTLLTSVYGRAPLAIYASAVPHGAYSFQAPTYRIPPKTSGPSIPVHHDNILIHKQIGYLKDSYGNRFVETPQSVAYKTTFPQQFVPLQELPSHLSQPLVAASPGIHFKQTVPHFSYGSPVRVPQYYHTPVPQSAALLQFNGGRSLPPAYAERGPHIGTQIQNRYTQASQSAAPQPSNQQIVYSNTHQPERYASLKQQPAAFQRLGEHGETGARNQKVIQNGKSSSKDDHPPATAAKQVTVINDGKNTVVSFTTKPPLPLLDLSLLQPLVFENPIVPQVQHYLPRINYVTYKALSPQEQPKKEDEIRIQSFYSDVLNNPLPEVNREEYQDSEPKNDSRESAPPSSEETSAEDERPNEFIPLVSEEDFHDERARQNSYQSIPIPPQYEYHERDHENSERPSSYHSEPHSSPPHLVRDVPRDSHQHKEKHYPKPHEHSDRPSSYHSEPHSSPPHPVRDVPRDSHQHKEKHYPKPHEHSDRPSSYHSEPQSSPPHPARDEPRDSHQHQEKHYPKHHEHSGKPLSYHSEPHTSPPHPARDEPRHSLEHQENHYPKPFTHSSKPHQHNEEDHGEDIPHQPQHHPNKQHVTLKQERPRNTYPSNVNVQQEHIQEWIPKSIPIQPHQQVLQEILHEPQGRPETINLPQFEEEYIMQEFEKQQFIPVAPHQGPQHDGTPAHVNKNSRIIIREEIPEEMHELREKITAEMIKEEENNEEDFEKAYKEAAYGFPAYTIKNDEEKDVYNPDNYGISREYDFENTPFQRYQNDGDEFPKSARLGYKDNRDRSKDEYFLDFSIKKPELMENRYRKKENYYKMYKKQQPEKYFSSGNKKPNSSTKKSEKYVNDYSYNPVHKKNGYSSQYRTKPQTYEYDYKKEAPKHSGFTHDSRPSPTFRNKWRTTQFVEPQFQYGFEPIPRLLDSELAAMASSNSPEREKPGTRKKIYKENWYIHKTRTSGGNADS